MLENMLRYENLSSKQQSLYDRLLWAIENKNGMRDGKSSEEILCELEAKDEQDDPKYTEVDIKRVLTAIAELEHRTLLAHAVFHGNKKALGYIFKLVATKYRELKKSIFTEPHYFDQDNPSGLSLCDYAEMLVEVYSEQGKDDSKDEAQKMVNFIKNSMDKFELPKQKQQSQCLDECDNICIGSMMWFMGIVFFSLGVNIPNFSISILVGIVCIIIGVGIAITPPTESKEYNYYGAISECDCSECCTPQARNTNY